MRGKAITMIGIAAVFGAISIFAADFWVKSQAKADAEEKTASIAAPAPPRIEFKTIVVANAPLRYGMELDRTKLIEIPSFGWMFMAITFGSTCSSGVLANSACGVRLK